MFLGVQKTIRWCLFYDWLNEL